MSFWSFSIDISTYIINHLFPTMFAYCLEFNHYWVSEHYIIESSKPSPPRSLTYLRQSPIKKTVAVSISTNKVKNSHPREYNTNHLKLPRNWFLSGRIFYIICGYPSGKSLSFLLNFVNKLGKVNHFWSFLSGKSLQFFAKYSPLWAGVFR